MCVNVYICIFILHPSDTSGARGVCGQGADEKVRDAPSPRLTRPSAAARFLPVSGSRGSRQRRRGPPSKSRVTIHDFRAGSGRRACGWALAARETNRASRSRSTSISGQEQEWSETHIYIPMLR